MSLMRNLINCINMCFRCMYFILDKNFVIILIKVRMKYFKQQFQIQKGKKNAFQFLKKT